MSLSLYERFRSLRDSFRACFERDAWRGEGGELTRDARRVLTELKGFCRAEASTFDPDPRVHALLEGRREVLLKIQGYLNLSDTDLQKLVDPDELARKEDSDG